MRRKAFTLIELMIVIFILGMLLVMATPIYKRMILKARTEEAKTVIQSILFAQERYKQERGSFYPDDDSSVANERLLAKELKISLNKSSNFTYVIEDLGGVDDGNFTVKAILRDRTLSDICTDETATVMCKQDGTANEDDWVNAYSVGSNKHFILFKYPIKYLDGGSIEGGIDYGKLYKN